MRIRRTMRGIPAAALLLVAACGGGGTGQPPATELARLVTLLAVTPSEGAAVHIEVRSDGELRWSATVPSGVTADVSGLTLNRGALGGDSDVVTDLLAGGAAFDGTGTASATTQVSAAEAADLAGAPGDFFLSLLLNSTAPVSTTVEPFTPMEWHTVLLGTNETTVADPDARGAATLRVDEDGSLSFIVAMVQPAATTIDRAHIHPGAAGVDGGILVDLDVPNATVDPNTNTMSGTVPITASALSRIAANPAAFYCNVHSPTAPAGVARGQLGKGPVELWSALTGDQEPTVVDADARGGATIELRDFASGFATLAVPSDTQAIDDVNGAHIHVGGPGEPGGILVNLQTGADYTTSPATASADGTIALTQEIFTRILANPGGFHVNFHTAAAPLGLVRGQLTRDPQTFFADLSGAEETDPVTPNAAGAASMVVTGVHQCSFTITMVSPPAADLEHGHVHDGPAGMNGPILVDFLGNGASLQGDKLSGTAAVPGRTFARLLASPELFYANMHTAAAPNGTARGQLRRLSGDTPPAGLVYDSPVTYQTGAAITDNAPTSAGGAVADYSIDPPLPAGLSLDPDTGVISGTPTAVLPATDFTVTASNDGGSTTAVVNITVEVGPPTSLAYTTPVTYVVGTAITPNTPTSTGGAISSFGVSPSLPAGLSLDPATGVISGTPTAQASAADYTITGTNAAGSTSATVNITVNQSLQPPSNLSYSSPVTYTTGNAITPNQPTVTGTVDTYSVSPALPQGLSINATTGVISGTPTTVTTAANYTVTASNAAGSTTATVNIAVTLGKPGSFSYSNDPNLGYTSTAIASMTPTHSGGGAVASYSISPALVNGLTINASTGVISGTPTATDEAGTVYTVTASNAAGSTTTTVTISVLP